MRTSFHKDTYLGKLHNFTDLIFFWAILGHLPLNNHYSSAGEQWGRDNHPDFYIYIYITIHMEVSQNGGTPNHPCLDGFSSKIPSITSISRWIFLCKPSIWGYHHWWNDTSSRSSQGASFFWGGRWGKKLGSHGGFRCVYIYIYVLYCNV